MTDQKITQKPRVTTVADTDIFMLVTNIDSIEADPETKAISGANLFARTTAIESKLGANPAAGRLTVENRFNESETGWVYPSGTYFYSGASTLYIAGDLTSIFQLGLKISFTQSSVKKYGYVISATYAAPNTTITIVGDTVTNTTVSGFAYSRADNPTGFPADFGFTSVITGFSGTPTQDIRWYFNGKEMMINFYITGTSNATTLSFTIPFSAGGRPRPQFCRGVDNTSSYSLAMLVPGYVSNVVPVFKDVLGTAWTASGTKTIQGLLTIMPF